MPPPNEVSTSQPPRVKLLLLAANPSSTTRLAIGAEYREIDECIRLSGAERRFEINQALEVRVDQLSTMLQRFTPDVVHFSGHGTEEGELILSDDAGQATPVDPARVADIFRLLARDLPVRCVVLNACYSETLAAELSKHVDCVVGISAELDDRTAITFAGAFYEALAFGRDVDTAYQLGCTEIYLVHGAGLDHPKLRHRPEVHPREVRFIPHAPWTRRSRQPSAPPAPSKQPSKPPMPPGSFLVIHRVRDFVGRRRNAIVAMAFAAAAAFTALGWSLSHKSASSVTPPAPPPTNETPTRPDPRDRSVIAVDVATALDATVDASVALDVVETRDAATDARHHTGDRARPRDARAVTAAAHDVVLPRSPPTTPCLPNNPNCEDTPR